MVPKLKIFVGTEYNNKEFPAELADNFKIEFVPMNPSLTRETRTKDFYSHIDSSAEYFIFGFRVPILFDQARRRIEMDFDGDRGSYHRIVSKGDAIVKSIGVKAKSVLDLSAGLAIDGIHIARAGYHVCMCERNPLLFFILKWSLESSELLKSVSVELYPGNPLQRILNSPGEFDMSRFDCVYFDPMYPEKNSTALPKQEMVLFRNLVGDDSDSVQWAQMAQMQIARLVIKRPVGSPALIDKPKYSIESKLVRYDIYERSP